MREGPSQPLQRGSFVSTGRRTGTGELVLLNNLSDRRASPAIKSTFQADATYFATGFLGSHELQVGVYLQPKLWNEDRTHVLEWMASPSKTVLLRDPANPAAGYVPFHRRIYDVAELVTKTVAASDYAVYVQDSWKPVPRLTLNSVVRVDWVTTEDRLFDVTVQDRRQRRSAAGCHLRPHGRQPQRGAGRAGAESTSRSSATTSRPPDRPPPGTWTSTTTISTGTFETSFVTPASRGSPPTGRSTPIATSRSWTSGSSAINGSFQARQGSTSSFVRRELPRSAGAGRVQRDLRERGVQRIQNEDFNQMYFVTNNSYNSLVYSGLEFTLSKRSDAPSVLAGYTRAWQHHSGTWQPNDPASFIQPDAFPNDRGLGTIRGNVTNSLSGSADTGARRGRSTRSASAASYLAPWGLVFAGNYSCSRGPYSGPVVTRIAAPDPAFGPPTLRLSNGRLVSNPLATTVRFAYPTEVKTDQGAHTDTVNVRAVKSIQFGGGTGSTSGSTSSTS